MASTTEYNRKYIKRIGVKKFRERQRKYMAKYRDENPEMYLLSAAKERAKKYNLKFTLVADDIVIPKRCPVLGIRLLKNRKGLQDSSPSIDRVNNRRGYTADNIVVVSLRANRIKSDATMLELQKIINFYNGDYHD